MAIFNPSPTPVQEEDFRSYSHPTSQMEGNKALGTALAGGGKVLSDAGELIKDYGKVEEFNTRQDIANSPELATANAARDSATAAYENYYNSKVDDTQKTINAPNAGLSLFPEGGPDKDMPTDLRSLPQLAGSMATAKLDTKVNQVLLTAEVDRQAKALRARYPDHADYIDQQFQRAGFGKTANAKYQALQNFFIAANANKDEDKKAAIAYGRSHSDVPDVAPLIQDVHNDVPGAVQKLENHINKFESYRTGLTVANSRFELDSKTSAYEAKRSAETFASGIVNASISSQYDKSGLTSPQKISDRIAYLRQHGNEIDPQELLNLDNDLVNIKQQSINYGMKYLTGPIMDPTVKGPVQVPKTDSQGRQMSTAALLPNGVADARTIMNSAVQPIDDMREAIRNKEWGLSAHTAQMMDVYTDQRLKSMLADKDLVEYGASLRAAIKFNQDWGQKMFEATYPQGTAAMNGWIKNHQVAQVANANPLKDPLGKLAASGDNPQSAQYLINNITSVWKTPQEGGLKDDESKRNVAKAFFAPENQGNLKFFPDDRFDTDARGLPTFIPGRMSIYKKMTDPRVTDEMKRLGPDTWDMYKKWVVHEHTDVLFNSQLRTFESFPQDYSQRLEFGWNDQSGHFEVKAKPSNDKRTPSRVPPPVSDMLAKVNSGLDNINYIGAKDGLSPTVYTLKALKEMNFNFGSQDPNEPPGFKGIPQELLRSVQKAVQPSTPYATNEEKAKLMRQEMEGRSKQAPDVPLPRERPKANIEPSKPMPTDEEWMKAQEQYLNSLKNQSKPDREVPVQVP